MVFKVHIYLYVVILYISAYYTIDLLLYLTILTRDIIRYEQLINIAHTIIYQMLITLVSYTLWSNLRQLIMTFSVFYLHPASSR